MPDSLNEFGAMLTDFLPDLLAALLVLIVGWLVAFLLSKLVENLLGRTNLDNRLAGTLQGGQPERIPIERWISLAVFWLVMVFVIVLFLNTLNLGNVADPLNGLLAQIVNFLPKLFAAALLFLLAWVIATVLRLVITRVMNSSAFTRRVTETAQVDARNRVTIGQTVGNIVYWLVFLLFLPAILDTLELQGILTPIAGMVDNILGAIPNIFGAVILLAIAYFVARLIGTLATSLLAGIGFNRIFAPDGPIPVTGVAATRTDRPMTDVSTGGASTVRVEDEPRPAVRRAGQPGDVQTGRTTPAEIVGYIVTVAIVLFAAMEAANLLGFEALTTMISGFIVMAVNILFGLVIFGIGLYLANQAFRLIRNTGTTNANILARAAQVAIIVFSGALALRQMGIAESIVNLAFGLLLGAVAVAAALAFGLGGRETAGQLLDRWRTNARIDVSRPATSIPRTGSTQEPPERSVPPFTE